VGIELLEREQLEQLLNKKVRFQWQDANKQTFSKGTLTKVTDTSITILYDNKIQLYSLSSLITMREVDVQDDT